MATDIAEKVRLEGGVPPATDAPQWGGPGGDGVPRVEPARLGLWLLLGTLSMMFIGFTSAYLVRRASPDWQPLQAPSLLWVNTLVLLASSATLERARHGLRSWDLATVPSWLGLTALLGFTFAGGQVAAWRLLAAQGVFLASNPHSSFFYLLTGLHVLHVGVGLVWLAASLGKVWRRALPPGEDGLSLLSTYWHFLGALWVYLMALLFLV